MGPVRIKVSLEAKSPLVLGRGPTIQYVWESRPFVAGGVLRGALAQVILQQLGIHQTSGRIPTSLADASAKSAFKEVFIAESPSRFGWLYPLYLRPDEKVFDFEVFPAPCTTFACKPYGEKHGLIDMLGQRLYQAIGGQREERRFFCKECGWKERIERWRGFVIRKPDGTYVGRKDVERRSMVRVGLNRLTETAEEQILYVLEALLPRSKSSGQEPGGQLVFTGSWVMTSAQWEQLKSLLEEFFLPQDGGYRLRIGTARARGMGEVILRLQEATPTDDLSQRLEGFQPKSSDGSPLDSQHLYFSLTARSPVLVFNEWGLPETDLSPDILKAYIDEKTLPKGIELITGATAVEQETLSGWSQAWGLPKPLTPVIAAGSVFTYRAPKGEYNAVLDFLRHVETYGLGERRSEGLGELVACEPFHIIRGRWPKDGDSRG